LSSILLTWPYHQSWDFSTYSCISCTNSNTSNYIKMRETIWKLSREWPKHVDVTNKNVELNIFASVHLLVSSVKWASLYVP
jgi:hypothetical protein